MNVIFQLIVQHLFFPLLLHLFSSLPFPFFFFWGGAHVLKNTLLFPYLVAQEVEKQCRCGKHTKRMPCHKPYLCETKCTKIRDCQKHQCRRKVSVWKWSVANVFLR